MPDRQNRFNFTGRQRILREHVKLGLNKKAQCCEIEVQVLDLSSYSVYPTAELVLETRVGRQGYNRVSLGTVREHTTSATLPLAEYETAVATFAIKVVGTGDNDRGKLLAIAEHLSLESDDEVRSLLPVLPSDDLGQVLWRLEIQEDNGPELQINYRCGDWQGLARSPDFQVKVFPQIAKEILVWVALSSEVDEDPNSVLGKWRALFEAYGANFREIENNSDEVETAERVSALESWAFGVVLSMANDERPLDRFLQIHGEGSEIS